MKIHRIKTKYLILVTVAYPRFWVSGLLSLFASVKRDSKSPLVPNPGFLINIIRGTEKDRTETKSCTMGFDHTHPAPSPLVCFPLYLYSSNICGLGNLSRGSRGGKVGGGAGCKRTTAKAKVGRWVSAQDAPRPVGRPVLTVVLSHAEDFSHHVWNTPRWRSPIWFHPQPGAPPWEGAPEAPPTPAHAPPATPPDPQTPEPPPGTPGADPPPLGKGECSFDLDSSAS